MFGEINFQNIRAAFNQAKHRIDLRTYLDNLIKQL